MEFLLRYYMIDVKILLDIFWPITWAKFHSRLMSTVDLWCFPYHIKSYLFWSLLEGNLLYSIYLTRLQYSHTTILIIVFKFWVILHGKIRDSPYILFFKIPLGTLPCFFKINYRTILGIVLILYILYIDLSCWTSPGT